MQVATTIDGDNGMVVKRLSVPIGLEELMESLTKEVLLRNPADIYTFASEHFAHLLCIRNKKLLDCSHDKNIKKTYNKKDQHSIQVKSATVATKFNKLPTPIIFTDSKSVSNTTTIKKNINKKVSKYNDFDISPRSIDSTTTKSTSSETSQNSDSYKQNKTGRARWKKQEVSKKLVKQINNKVSVTPTTKHNSISTINRNKSTDKIIGTPKQNPKNETSKSLINDKTQKNKNKTNKITDLSKSHCLINDEVKINGSSVRLARKKRKSNEPILTVDSAGYKDLSVLSNNEVLSSTNQTNLSKTTITDNLSNAYLHIKNTDVKHESGDSDFVDEDDKENIVVNSMLKSENEQFSTIDKQNKINETALNCNSKNEINIVGEEKIVNESLNNNKVKDGKQIIEIEYDPENIIIKQDSEIELINDMEDLSIAAATLENSKYKNADSLKSVGENLKDNLDEKMLKSNEAIDLDSLGSEYKNTDENSTADSRNLQAENIDITTETIDNKDKINIFNIDIKKEINNGADVDVEIKNFNEKFDDNSNANTITQTDVLINENDDETILVITERMNADNNSGSGDVTNVIHSSGTKAINSLNMESINTEDKEAIESKEHNKDIFNNSSTDSILTEVNDNNENNLEDNAKDLNITTTTLQEETIYPSSDSLLEKYAKEINLKKNVIQLKKDGELDPIENETLVIDDEFVNNLGGKIHYDINDEIKNIILTQENENNVENTVDAKKINANIVINRDEDTNNIIDKHLELNIECNDNNDHKQNTQIQSNIQNENKIIEDIDTNDIFINKNNVNTIENDQNERFIADNNNVDDLNVDDTNANHYNSDIIDNLEKIIEHNSNDNSLTNLKSIEDSNEIEDNENKLIMQIEPKETFVPMLSIQNNNESLNEVSLNDKKLEKLCEENTDTKQSASNENQISKELNDFFDNSNLTESGKLVENNKEMDKEKYDTIENLKDTTKLNLNKPEPNESIIEENIVKTNEENDTLLVDSHSNDLISETKSFIDYEVTNYVSHNNDKGILVENDKDLNIKEKDAILENLKDATELNNLNKPEQNENILEEIILKTGSAEDTEIIEQINLNNGITSKLKEIEKQNEINNIYIKETDCNDEKEVEKEVIQNANQLNKLTDLQKSTEIEENAENVNKTIKENYLENKDERSANNTIDENSSLNENNNNNNNNSYVNDDSEIKTDQSQDKKIIKRSLDSNTKPEMNEVALVKPESNIKQKLKNEMVLAEKSTVGIKNLEENDNIKKHMKPVEIIILDPDNNLYKDHNIMFLENNRSIDDEGPLHLEDVSSYLTNKSDEHTLNEHKTTDISHKDVSAEENEDKSISEIDSNKDLESEDGNTQNCFGHSVDLNVDIPEKELLSNYPRCHANAAIKIQSLWRGYKIRNSFKESQMSTEPLTNNVVQNLLNFDNDNNKAATLIQSVIRGHLVRKQFKKGLLPKTSTLEDVIEESRTGDDIINDVETTTKLHSNKMQQQTVLAKDQSDRCTPINEIVQDHADIKTMNKSHENIESIEFCQNNNNLNDFKETEFDNETENSDNESIHILNQIKNDLQSMQSLIVNEINEENQNNNYTVQTFNNNKNKHENENITNLANIINATIKIQSLFRGYKVRNKNVNVDTNNENALVIEDFQKTSKDEQMQAAAKKIQSVFRGYMVRNKNDKLDINNENAFNVGDINERSKQEQMEATAIINDNLFINDENVVVVEDAKEMSNQDQMDAAATKIQSLFRGYKVRNNDDKVDINNENLLVVNEAKERSKQEQMHEAATKIQSLFRGYTVRNKNDKVDINNENVLDVRDVKEKLKQEEMQSSTVIIDNIDINNGNVVVVEDANESLKQEQMDAAAGDINDIKEIAAAIVNDNANINNENVLDVEGADERLKQEQIDAAAGDVKEISKQEQMQATIIKDDKVNINNENVVVAEHDKERPKQNLVDAADGHIEGSQQEQMEINDNVNINNENVMVKEDDKESRKQVQMEAAATKIQSLFRGYTVRNKNDKVDLNNENVVIVENDRERSKQINAVDGDVKEGPLQEQMEAVAIRNDNVDVNNENVMDDTDDKESTKQIQMEAAATKIQSLFRGYTVRNKNDKANINNVNVLVDRDEKSQIQTATIKDNVDIKNENVVVVEDAKDTSEQEQTYAAAGDAKEEPQQEQINSASGDINNENVVIIEDAEERSKQEHMNAAVGNAKEESEQEQMKAGTIKNDNVDINNGTVVVVEDAEVKSKQEQMNSASGDATEKSEQEQMKAEVITNDNVDISNENVVAVEDAEEKSKQEQMNSASGDATEKSEQKQMKPEEITNDNVDINNENVVAVEDDEEKSKQEQMNIAVGDAKEEPKQEQMKAEAVTNDDVNIQNENVMAVKDAEEKSKQEQMNLASGDATEKSEQEQMKAEVITNDNVDINNENVVAVEDAKEKSKQEQMNIAVGDAKEEPKQEQMKAEAVTNDDVNIQNENVMAVKDAEEKSKQEQMNLASGDATENLEQEQIKAEAVTNDDVNIKNENVVAVEDAKEKSKQEQINLAVGDAKEEPKQEQMKAEAVTNDDVNIQNQNVMAVEDAEEKSKQEQMNVAVGDAKEEPKEEQMKAEAVTNDDVNIKNENIVAVEDAEENSKQEQMNSESGDATEKTEQEKMKTDAITNDNVDINNENVVAVEDVQEMSKQEQMNAPAGDAKGNIKQLNKDAAATKIQSLFRGYTVRNKNDKVDINNVNVLVATDKNSQEQMHKAAIINDNVDINNKNVVVVEDTTEKLNQEQKQASAATIIQRLFREYMVRNKNDKVDINKKNAEDDIESTKQEQMQAAATKIQNYFINYLIRKKNNENQTSKEFITDIDNVANSKNNNILNDNVNDTKSTDIVAGELSNKTMSTNENKNKLEVKNEKMEFTENLENEPRKVENDNTQPFYLHDPNTNIDNPIANAIRISSRASKQNGNITLLHTGEFHDSVNYSHPDVQVLVQEQGHSSELHDANVLLQEVQQTSSESLAGDASVTLGREKVAHASLNNTTRFPSKILFGTGESVLDMDEKRNNANFVETAMESDAATKIQASFRGYQVRKQLNSKNLGTVNPRRSSRRKNSKSNENRRVEPVEVEERSATKIQAGVRGFLVRQRQKQKRSN